MTIKKRSELPATVDPSTMKYIRQITGKEPAFPPSLPEVPGLSEKQRQFIRAYGSSGGITKTALREASASREELEQWKTEDGFKKAYQEAQDDWVEELRKAAMLRATSKSDVLLMFLLKALRPDVFDEDVRKQQFVGINSSKDHIPVRATLVRDNTINVTLDSAETLTIEKAEELRDILTNTFDEDQ